MPRWLVLAVMLFPSLAGAEPPSPTLSTIFPAGGQAGTRLEVALQGASLEGLNRLWANDARVASRVLGDSRIEIALPADLLPGLYDMLAVGTHGISAPRAFFVGRLAERLEVEPNDSPQGANPVDVSATFNGRIDKPGDVDYVRIQANEGARLVFECWAERIDSPLRAVLEVHDSQGKLLAANRGFAGIDPLVALRLPATGEYVVKVHDLTYAGGAGYVYRLDIDTGPRPIAVHPCSVERGRTTRVSVFGYNLSPAAEVVGTSMYPVENIQVDVTPPAGEASPARLRLKPGQLSGELFAWDCPGGHYPLAMSVTDVPVIQDGDENHSPGAPQALSVPCEVAGRLMRGNEQDWYSFAAREGEVLWIEAFGDRLGSPVDLDLAILDEAGQRELAHWSDGLVDLGGYAFCTAHLDPSGRFVAPADGRYLLIVRNLSGADEPDFRRVYRLNVRREAGDFSLAAVNLQGDQPRALNIPRGGRALLEVIAVRRRGLTAPIRVTARDLPPGIECPDVWLGPGVERAPLVVTAAADAPAFAQALSLQGVVNADGLALAHAAVGGAVVLSGQTMPSGRIAAVVAAGLTGEAPGLLLATTERPAVDQGGVLDLAVDVQWRQGASQAPIELTAVSLPPGMSNALSSIPPGQSRGAISFFVPASLAPGPYTLAIQATARMPGTKDNDPTVALLSNAVTFDVRPARFLLAVDPHAPRKIARGQTIQLNYKAQRVNGFIGKIHTELTAPGGVVGLRARGVTFVGQTDAGVLQIVATENAPLGRQSLLRLEGVGTVEDQPIYRAACPVELEIVE